jgi:hypothetical protein
MWINTDNRPCANAPIMLPVDDDLVATIGSGRRLVHSARMPVA